MNLEIRKQTEESILESLDRAGQLAGEDRAQELKNVAILIDKLQADYETEETILDRRHKMEFEKELEKMKLAVEREKIETEYKSKGRINKNSLINTVVVGLLGGASIFMEVRGFIPPKIFSSLFNKLGRNKD